MSAGATSSGCVQVTVTAPERDEAERIARTVVEERLAACAQVHGPVTSTFWWEGRIDSAQEWYCHLKTSIERVPALTERIRSLHAYDTPEIIAVPIVDGSDAYLRWVRETVTS